MSDSFEINDGLLDTDSTDLLDDALQDAIQKLEARRLRLLAHAYHAGYDGVDIIPAQDVYTRVEDFRLSFKYEAWEGIPLRPQT